MICEIAPAKINLTLEILGRRKDGYHDIKSVMQTIDLCDVLTFWENEWVHIVPDYGSLPGNDTLSDMDQHNYMGKNLVYRAARALKEATGYSGGALIQLKKSIPSSAGLGGGSSDAAAVLKGLNRLWKLGLTDDELIGIGADIGSDVAFFIHGGTCLIEGRGEIVKPIRTLQPKWILILLIPIKLEGKTKKLYSYIDSSHYSKGDSTTGLCERINRYGGEKSSMYCSIESSLFNVFEKVYHNGYEEFGEWQRYFSGLEMQGLHLAGSGPAVFYLSDTEDEILGIVKNDLWNKSDIIKYIARTVP